MVLFVGVLEVILLFVGCCAEIRRGFSEIRGGLTQIAQIAQISTDWVLGSCLWVVAFYLPQILGLEWIILIEFSLFFKKHSL